MRYRNYELDLITERIIKCVFKVSNIIGSGFLERVYENSLIIELENEGLKFKHQAPIKVFYSGKTVGLYYADILVEDKVIIELKTVKAIEDVHLAQCLNYLKATNLNVCLLINFAMPKVMIKRVVNNL